jgi:hypothetical protein
MVKKVGEKWKIEPEDTPSITNVKVEVPDLPTLIPFNEFLFSMRNSHYVETLGGFAYWIKRNKGIPSKASAKYWRECLKEFLERKL